MPISFAQSTPTKITWNSLIHLDNDTLLSYAQKLKTLCELEKGAASTRSPQDSTYAGILLKIGKYEFLANRDYFSAIKYTQNALVANTAATKKISNLVAANCYYNLGFFYKNLMYDQNALAYFDSTIALAQTFPDSNGFTLDSRTNKADILFLSGDYQKCIDECSIGINQSLALKDTFHYVVFMNRKAQSLFFENKLDQALEETDKVIFFEKKVNAPFELATAYKIKALAYEKKNKFELAKSFFFKTIEARLYTKQYDVIASDYNDLGNFYHNSLHDYTSAEMCYFKTIQYAKRIDDPAIRSAKMAMAHVNLGENSIIQNKLNDASLYLITACHELNLKIENDILTNPSAKELNLIGNKDLILVLMADKTSLLMQFFKKSKESKYLLSAIHAAFITDSIIADTRHQQIEEQSKLYWRNRTREFYSSTIEDCFFARQPENAFFFMEKSRAVLLNDKLNELGASALLSQNSLMTEQTLRAELINQQQKLSQLKENTEDYNDQNQLYLEKKSAYANFIKSLEKKYPAYYQYKYADKVPSLKALQQYLAKDTQSFVHYFISDTAIYMLAITADSTKMVKRSCKNYRDTLAAFMRLCSNRQLLNSHYDAYAKAANAIYETLFAPLQLPKGRVVICTDNFLIPFEALCSDQKGEQFLAYDYSISYVYSANYLLKSFNNPSPSENFLGLAPVNFNDKLQLPALKNSDKFLESSASFYNGTTLLTGNEATKQHFLSMIPAYEIINVFSHARADSSDEEPVLFMSDSSVMLSELQKIMNPSARLIVLSACQTNTGKSATGEGIYSLARGFSAAGIPNVAATIWKADDLTIYNITQRFHENIANGMRLDDALQKAKLAFLKNSNTEKSMPYYWANMILVGNAEPVILTSPDRWLWWIGGGIVFIGIGAYSFARKRKTGASKH